MNRYSTDSTQGLIGREVLPPSANLRFFAPKSQPNASNIFQRFESLKDDAGEKKHALHP